MPKGLWHVPAFAIDIPTSLIRLTYYLMLWIQLQRDWPTSLIQLFSAKPPQWGANLAKLSKLTPSVPFPVQYIGVVP